MNHQNVAWDFNWLFQLAYDLDRIDRLGSTQDEPEGSRYIQISDTYAIAISEKLKSIAREATERFLRTVEQENNACLR